MDESGAKRPAKLLQRDRAEENDRADTLSGACQVGDTEGDVPVHLSKLTKLAEAPESTQEAPLLSFFYNRVDVPAGGGLLLGVLEPVTFSGLVLNLIRILPGGCSSW